MFDSSSAPPFHLIPFHGAAAWYQSVRSGTTSLRRENGQAACSDELVLGSLTSRSWPNSNLPFETILAYMKQTTSREIDAMLLAGTGTQSLPLKGTLSASPAAIWLLNA